MADNSRSEDSIVVLHQFKRSTLIPVPNASPFGLKLETFLRMAKIPYKVNGSFKFSSKGKMPWIEHKGKAIADSGFCIEYLSKEFGVDVDSGLTVEERAIATAFRVMLEENTFWTLVHYRYLSDYASTWRDLFMESVPLLFRRAQFWVFQGRVKDELWGHGIGRHTESELYSLGERDLRAVSTYLGDKEFLFGDKPCLADAALFALVSNLVWTMQGSPQEKAITKEMQNLIAHAQRMKEAYYTDWDELISGNEKE